MSLRTPDGSTNAPATSGGPAEFPSSARLLRHADFERVYKQGRRHFASHMTVFYLRRAEGQGLRVGFTVGRGLGGAVDRNRMKRRLREAVRRYRLSVSAAADAVINPKRSLLKAEFSEILQEVERAFGTIQHKLQSEALAQERKA